MADISADLQQELDQLQAEYKAAVDDWVAAIREEEALASGNHNVAELDQWEAAHFREHKLHKEVDLPEAPLRECAAPRVLRLLIFQAPGATGRAAASGLGRAPKFNRS